MVQDAERILLAYFRVLDASMMFSYFTMVVTDVSCCSTWYFPTFTPPAGARQQPLLWVKPRVTHLSCAPLKAESIQVCRSLVHDLNE
jgi:hypothetical protein